MITLGAPSNQSMGYKVVASRNKCAWPLPLQLGSAINSCWELKSSAHALAYSWWWKMHTECDMWLRLTMLFSSRSHSYPASVDSYFQVPREVYFNQKFNRRISSRAQADYGCIHFLQNTEERTNLLQRIRSMSGITRWGNASLRKALKSPTASA